LTRRPFASRIGGWARRLVAQYLVRRGLDLQVSGLEHVPVRGPAILVARHYHHLYDATAILASVPREIHILIALDWLGGETRLGLMRWLAAAARWPGVWRAGRGWRFNRAGYRLSLELLREGGLLLVFPEGYPAIDPQRGSRVEPPDAWLPFDAGFAVLAERAGGQVPIVPVGLAYAPRSAGGWRVELRFGSPICATGGSTQRQRLLQLVDAEVRRLSAAPVS
jgi:1-acyl-sn-glycerol-3-phosphate acyltransferase